MAGAAKILTNSQIRTSLKTASLSRYPERNIVTILLSTKAGLRAGEIAKLTWPMITSADGRVGDVIELPNHAAKKCSGRTIPINPRLHKALMKLHRMAADDGPVIRSERGRAMTPAGIVNWFAGLYRSMGLEGCSSHSGRRTFITNLARNIHRVVEILRDTLRRTDRESIQVTQRYIDGNPWAPIRAVDVI